MRDTNWCKTEGGSGHWVSIKETKMNAKQYQCDVPSKGRIIECVNALIDVQNPVATIKALKDLAVMTSTAYGNRERAECHMQPWEAAILTTARRALSLLGQ